VRTAYSYVTLLYEFSQLISNLRIRRSTDKTVIVSVTVMTAVTNYTGVTRLAFWRSLLVLDLSVKFIPLSFYVTLTFYLPRHRNIGVKVIWYAPFLPYWDRLPCNLDPFIALNYG
jgi:hypothetical protein